MNKRGIVLVFSLIVVVVLVILYSSFVLQSVNESSQVKRYEAGVRAFWLAETGIAEAIKNLPSTSVSGTLGGARYTYQATAQDLGNSYYAVVSTGTVTFPQGGSVARTLNTVIKTGEIHPEKFQYAIETTTKLVIKGSVDINPDDSKKEYATLDFADMFSYSKADMRSNAAHLYTPSNFAAPVDGITWVDVPSGQTLTVTGNLTGSGILIVSGNAHFAGTVDFDGIIYVIGELTITGTVVTQGAVLAESSATVDTELKGNPTLNYNAASITNALNNVKFLIKNSVYWKETS